MKSLWIAGGLAVSVATAVAQTGADPAPAAAAPASTAPAVVPSGSDNIITAAPFSKPSPSITDTAGAEELWKMGRDALANGFTTIAVNYFQTALTKPGLSIDRQDELNLGLATAYMAQGKYTAAETALKAVAYTGTSAYALRVAMLSACKSDWLMAAAQAGQINPTALSSSDRPWYYALQATLAEQNHRIDDASKAWTQAMDSSTTQIQKARFETALYRATILLTGDATLAEAENLRKQAETNASPSVSAEYLRLAALMFNKIGQRDQALALLRSGMDKAGLSRVNKDNLRLTFALIDNEDPKHSNASLDQKYLEGILADRLDPGEANQKDLAQMVQIQKIALTLLQNMLFGGITPPMGDTPGQLSLADPTHLLQTVGDLITKQPDHPLLKQLRILQAQLALHLNKDADAVLAAKAVLELPPDTGRDVAREDAWRLLAYVYWKSQQYKSAAESLGKLLKELPPTESSAERKDITLQMADWYFLSKDYEFAGDYYTSLLSDPNPPVSPGPGVLLIRAVESELQAGKLEDALKRVDDARAKPNYDDAYSTYRWQAWFNVLDALSRAGREREAFERIKSLLDPAHGGGLLSTGLQLRLYWLDADLAVSLQDPSAAAKAALLQQLIENTAAENTPDLDAKTRRQLAASALSLRLKAADNDQKPKEKEEFYNELQKKYPDTDEAITAVLQKAFELGNQGQSLTAQQLVADLAGRLSANPETANSAWIPTARYYEAYFASARGVTDQYADALKKLDRFVHTYPNDPLVYKAQLLEADLLRLRSTPEDVAAALQIYNDLLTNFPNNKYDDPIVAEAAMGRAKCYIAMAGDNPNKRNDAIKELEFLFTLEHLPTADRVEAGYDWGFLLENDSSPTADRATNLVKANEAYWAVVSKFLLDPAKRNELLNSVEGRSFMSDCLIHSAGIYRQLGKFYPALRSYQLVIDNNLPYKEYAESLQKALGEVAPPEDSVPAPLPPPPPPPPPTDMEAPPANPAASEPADTAPVKVPAPESAANASSPSH